MAKQRSERYPDITSFILALSLSPLVQSGSSTTFREDNIPTVRSSRSQPQLRVYEPTKRNARQQRATTIRNSQRSSLTSNVERSAITKESKAQESSLPRWKLLLHFFFVFLEVILFMRFLFRIAGADSSNLFVSFLFAITDLVLFPFATIIEASRIGPLGPYHSQIWEWNTLIGLAVYALAFWIVLRRLRVSIRGRSL